MSRRKGPQADIAFNFIRDKIISYNYPPDFVVSDSAIAAELGIGRMAVREAMIRLSMYGLIVHNGTGFVVSPFSYSDIIEIHQIRRAIQWEAISLIFKNGGLSDEQIAHLSDIVSHLEKSLESESFADNNQYDAEFHNSIISYSNNSRLIRIANQEQLEIMRALWVNVLETHNRRKAAHEEHKRILQAFRDGDCEACQNAICEHIENAIIDAQRIRDNPFYQISVQCLYNL